MTKPHITTFVAPVVVYARNPSSMSVMSLGLMPRRTHYKLGMVMPGGLEPKTIFAVKERGPNL